jgi:hypothetical protein
MRARCLCVLFRGLCRSVALPMFRIWIGSMFLASSLLSCRCVVWTWTPSRRTKNDRPEMGPCCALMSVLRQDPISGRSFYSSRSVTV